MPSTMTVIPTSVDVLREETRWVDYSVVTFQWKWLQSLLVPSDGHRSIPNHRQYDCLSNSLIRLTTKTPNLCITSRLWRNSPVTVRFPSQKVSNAESVSMLWCRHVIVCHQHKFLNASLTGIFIVYIDLKINKFRLSCCKLHTEADIIFHLVLFCPNNMHTGEYTHDVFDARSRYLWHGLVIIHPQYSVGYYY